MTLVEILGAALLAALLAALGWYLLIKTEGVYLGWRVVIWLYDLYAGRYDRIKGFDRTYETLFLARPIINRLRPLRAPLVLDVATGTGRLPLALLEQEDFQGQVVGLDLSRKMLFQAAVNLAGYPRRYDLVWHTAAKLPFPDETFDLVTCLEALEFLPHPRVGLRELARVVRGGGTLLITNRRGRAARLLMPGRIFPTETLLALMQEELGLVDIRVERWQIDYDLVWARKPGESPPVEARPLWEIVRCPRCGEVEMVPLSSGEWVCTACEVRAPVGEDGVLELFRAG